MEAKPCPFCKSSASLKIGEFGGNDYVCSNGDCSLYQGMPIHEWNTRPIEDAQAVRIAELDAQLAAVQPWAEACKLAFGDWVQLAASEELTEDEDVCLICGDSIDHPNVPNCPILPLITPPEAANV